MKSMGPRTMVGVWALIILMAAPASWASPPFRKSQDTRRFVQVAAQDKYERSQIASLGMSIEAVRSDSVWGFANSAEIQDIQSHGFKILGNFPLEVGRGGHDAVFDFPGHDSAYHNYQEMQGELQALHAANPDITRVISIGKSVEGRNLFAIHINTSAPDLDAGKSTKPGAIFMGAHHAREHLSVEVPLLLAKYLLEQRNSPEISSLLENRDIWIIPMVNPDGAEFDIATGDYQFWRKNRRKEIYDFYGVDLNRNYGYQWGTGGSSNSPASDIYRGPAPFSEPETQAIRDFVRSQKNTRTLLTFHTYSELILYPWGYTHSSVSNKQDRAVFKKMAETMAQWNHYTPEQSSDLYITSGDTVDWAYGELGIFAFTFELSPGSHGGMMGFYPGPAMIERAFNDNLKPCLYLIQSAGDPYAVINGSPTRWMLKTENEPAYFAAPF